MNKKGYWGGDSDIDYIKIFMLVLLVISLVINVLFAKSLFFDKETSLIKEDVELLKSQLNDCKLERQVLTDQLALVSPCELEQQTEQQ